MSEQELRDVEGVVKWFDPRKGYGFIAGPEGQDIFAHYTVIEGEGFRALRDGSHVIYSADNSDKGWRATRIVRLEDSTGEITVLRARPHARSPRR